MSDVKSKNLYELLGNTSDQDSDREPEPPTKAVDKTAARSGKRDAPKQAPAAPAENVGGGRGGRAARGDRSGGFNANETAFRDKMTGRERNRQQETGDDAAGDKRRGGRGRGGPRRGGDRHSRTAVTDHQKQVGHGWGEQTGDGEWADERAGERIANQERKEAVNDGEDENVQPAGDANASFQEAEPEPEDNSKSYTEWLAEKAAKKLEDLGLKEARAPNEGAKEDKKWTSAKELVKESDEDYFKGEEKAGRQRERGRNAKEFVDIDFSFKEQAREARGGRGGARGGRGRGDRGDRGERAERGDRGDRGDRAERAPRGEFGGRGRGRGAPRGEFRGERRGGAGGRGGAIAVNDQTAFPSLGGK